MRLTSRPATPAAAPRAGDRRRPRHLGRRVRRDRCGDAGPGRTPKPSTAVAVESIAPEPSAATTTVAGRRDDLVRRLQGRRSVAATAEITEGRGGTVAIEATFENTGSEDGRFDGSLNLASAGENATEGLAMDIPSVPGGQTGKGTLAFDVEDSFTFDDAVLTVGLAENQQAIVPLTATAGTAVTQEPVAVSAIGRRAPPDTLKLELARRRVPRRPAVEPRPDEARDVRADRDATTPRSCPTSRVASPSPRENVALRLPDGTTGRRDPRRRAASRSSCIGPESTAKDQFSRFEIEDPAAGDYALLVRSFDDAEDEIPFTIK